MDNELAQLKVEQPKIITFTTDFGTSDYFNGALKGSLLTQCFQENLPPPLFVDISNTIKNYDIIHAAHTLRNAWNFFPAGTVHVVCVDNSDKKKLRYLAFEYQNHYFIGPDNGLFSLMFEDLPKLISVKPMEGINFSNINTIVTDAVKHILMSLKLENWGKRTANYDKKFLLKPVITPDQIRGCVVYVDGYQNLITNISRDTFNSVGKGRAFNLYFKRHEPIKKLSPFYNDVAVGETLCLFNNDLLEIAIYLGKAAEMHGLKMDDTVQLDFFNN